MIKKQFTLYMENKPGMLAKVTESLATAKVNIEGISVSESTDIALVQIVVSNAAVAERLLNRSHIPFTIQDVCLLPLRNQPGSLARIVAKLARQGVNINYVYATGCTCKDACDCFVVIGSPNLKKVEAAWRNLR
jgi:hypothetical protein